MKIKKKGGGGCGNLNQAFLKTKADKTNAKSKTAATKAKINTKDYDTDRTARLKNQSASKKRAAQAHTKRD